MVLLLKPLFKVETEELVTTVTELRKGDVVTVGPVYLVSMDPREGSDDFVTTEAESRYENVVPVVALGPKAGL